MEGGESRGEAVTDRKTLREEEKDRGKTEVEEEGQHLAQFDENEKNEKCSLILENINTLT